MAVAPVTAEDCKAYEAYAPPLPPDVIVIFDCILNFIL